MVSFSTQALFRNRALGLVLIAAAAFTASFGAVAAGWEAAPAANEQVDDFAAGKKAIDAKDWKLAVGKFSDVVVQDPKNADAYNYLGYSYRWLGQYDNAFAAYGKALALAPNHKGALNYSGIAYLKVGKVDLAQAQLAKLQSVCAQCDETLQLTKAIAEFTVTAK